jgi:hypothetical protein
MAFLGEDHKAAILGRGEGSGASPLVEAVQIDVADDDMMASRAFAPPKTSPDEPWDFVVNLAAETALGKSESF